jgi:hypothetical protein
VSSPVFRVQFCFSKVSTIAIKLAQSPHTWSKIGAPVTGARRASALGIRFNASTEALPDVHARCRCLHRTRAEQGYAPSKPARDTATSILIHAIVTVCRHEPRSWPDQHGGATEVSEGNAVNRLAAQAWYNDPRPRPCRFGERFTACGVKIEHSSIAGIMLRRIIQRSALRISLHMAAL